MNVSLKNLRRNVIDMVGERYGKLVVIARAGTRGKSAAWSCLCDCGNTKIVARQHLTSKGRKATRSCGCARKTGAGSRPSYKTPVDPLEAARRSVIRTYKRNAKEREIPWEMTDGELIAKTQGDCFYCQAAPSNVSKNGAKISKNRGEYRYNGLDRLDNDGPYSVKNTVPCCYTCNRAKNKMGVDDFYAWVARVYLKMTSNCRWADPRTQATNKQSTWWITAPDPDTGEPVKLCLADWARRLGIGDSRMIRRRLGRGWNEVHAVTWPPLDSGQRYWTLVEQREPTPF